jgi:competence protein ComEA
MKTIKAVLLAVSLLSVPAFAGQVDINSADAKMLDKELAGVGPKIAQAIVDYRAEHGPFRSADDLLKVKGLKQGTLDKNRDRILLGKPAK